MIDLNEKLAQEAAELINGGEWRDGKWYSEGHRDAWRRALKPAADRIEKLKAELHHCFHRIEELQAALRNIAEGDIPRTVKIQFRDDGQSSKHDRCEHGQWLYEDCGCCIEDYARKALEGKDD
jgi:hypothetical protein